ncbi:MAG TPA: hypothetical protein VGH03_18720 [Caulobacteraceae bacterium]|jgi:hypothetical protein
MNVKILVPGVVAAVLTVGAAAAQTAPGAPAGAGSTSAMAPAAGADSSGASMAPEDSMGSPDTGGPGPMDSNPPVDGAITAAADQVPTMGQGHDSSDTVGTPAEGTPDMSGPNQPQ